MEGCSEESTYVSLELSEQLENDVTVPPLWKAKIPSDVQLVLYLDKEKPLSEPRLVKTGDVQEWLRSMFGRMFWVAGDAADGWEKRVEVVDPDPVRIFFLALILLFSRLLIIDPYHLDAPGILGEQLERRTAYGASALPAHTYGRDRQHPRDPPPTRARRARVVLAVDDRYLRAECLWPVAECAVAGLRPRRAADPRLPRRHGDVPARGRVRAEGGRGEGEGRGGGARRGDHTLPALAPHLQELGRHLQGVACREEGRRSVKRWRIVGWPVS